MRSLHWVNQSSFYKTIWIPHDSAHGLNDPDYVVNQFNWAAVILTDIKVTLATSEHKYTEGPNHH